MREVQTLGAAGLGKAATPRPRVFVGSSSEGLRIAQLIQLELGDAITSCLWNQGVFPLTTDTLTDLVDASRSFHAAVLVFTPDDLRVTRGQAQWTVRENVLFELGLFLGALGRARTFVVAAEGVALPSDLSGVTVARFTGENDAVLRSSLGVACTLVREQLRAQTPPPVPKGKRIARRRRRRSLGVAVVVGEDLVYRIINISVTGMLLETERPIGVGRELEFLLHLDNEHTPLRATGEVARVQEPDWGRAAGVGVQFTRLGKEERRRLRAYVDADRAFEPAAVPLGC